MEPKPLNSGMCLVGDGGPGCGLSLSILAAVNPVAGVSGDVLSKREALVGDGKAGSLYVGSAFSGDMERDRSGARVVVSSSGCFHDFRGFVRLYEPARRAARSSRLLFTSSSSFRYLSSSSRSRFAVSSRMDWRKAAGSSSAEDGEATASTKAMIKQGSL